VKTKASFCVLCAVSVMMTGSIDSSWWRNGLKLSGSLWM